MTTTALAPPARRPAAASPESAAAPAISPSPATAPVASAPPDARQPDLPLVGRLRLNLTALGVDPAAPDFGERLCRLSQDNHPYDFEISAQGELIVIMPSGWETGANEQEPVIDLGLWRRDHGGASFAATVMFNLPSGARYMPDASWITQERYDALRAAPYQSTIDGAPDFVVEVRSRTDNLAEGLSKMQEWMDGGARLGWYLDPYATRAYIYRPGQPVEMLDNPETLSGEDVLPGFVFEIRRLIFARHSNPAPSTGGGDDANGDAAA